jgi:hypothetical protein
MSEGAPYPTWVADTGSTVRCPLCDNLLFLPHQLKCAATRVQAEEMQDHVDAFRRNMARLQKAVVTAGGFYWQMITGRGPLIRPSVPTHGAPHNVTAAQCADTLRKHYCVAKPDAWRSAHLYVASKRDPNIGEQAVAEFLLTRGDFAWLGNSWQGCESTTEFPRPAEWDFDYGGKPSAPCVETGHDTGVFTRDYAKAHVEWDCHLGKGKVTMKL